jgi:hypothetical protein
MALPEWHNDMNVVQRSVFYLWAVSIGAFVATLFATSASAGDAAATVRLKWLGRSGSEWRALLQHVVALGAVLAFAYVTEHTELVPRAEKAYVPDVFLFACLLLFVAAIATLRKTSAHGGAGDVLNREQSEEWKGWMQFLFVLYHQQHAVDAYNLIRVFVSAYVWMTGFGNFSFFYVRADYSLARILQMLWRLNFFVLAIMATMNTNYILYYIVPLHTFYFLLTFATMAIARAYNYTEWGPRVKIFVLALLIYIVWELEQSVHGIFDLCFAPVAWLVGESDWSLHEWHFRTFLDHYSALFGIVFAMNFPYLSAWFAAVERLPTAHRLALKSLAGGGWLAAFYWWYRNVFMLPKYEFNAAHPYWFWIPIMTYVYFRNLTPTLRSYHSSLLNWLGKITLETYLLQFHIFMVALNADGSWSPKRLVSLVPGYPLVNVLVCGLVFIGCAKVAFGATMALRDAAVGGSDWSWRELARRVPYVLASVGALLLVSVAMPLSDDWLLLGMALLAVGGFLWFFSLDLRL